MPVREEKLEQAPAKNMPVQKKPESTVDGMLRKRCVDNDLRKKERERSVLCRRRGGRVCGWSVR